MKTFVIIFRQTPPTPTPEERQRVAAEVVAWAQQVNAGATNSILAFSVPKA